MLIKTKLKLIMADLEAVLADVSYLMAMEKSKSTPAASASKKIVLPDRTYVIIYLFYSNFIFFNLNKIEYEVLHINIYKKCLKIHLIKSLINKSVCTIISF